MERVQLDIRPLPRGVRTIPNLGAPELEQALGIEFRLLPSTVLLTPVNRLFLVQVADLRSQYGLVDLIRNGGSKDNAGFYREDYHTCFQHAPIHSRTLGGRRAHYHENMHAFSHSLNPNLNPPTPVRMTPEEIEKSLVGLFFDEGLAHWGENEAIHRRDRTPEQRERDEEEKYSKDHKPYFHKALKDLVGYIDNYLPLISSYIEKVLSSDGEKYLNLSPKELSNFHHLGGEAFVRVVMHYLRTERLTIAESLELLIFNPTSRLEEIKNPVGYAKKLSDTRNDPNP